MNANLDALLTGYIGQMNEIEVPGRLLRRRATYRGAVRAALVLGAVDSRLAAGLYEEGERAFRARWEELVPAPIRPVDGQQ